jgi:segregation and condensation protein A
VDTGTAVPEIVAVIEGLPLMALPEGLYVPPGALEVLLDSFRGPLDLLLYLIKKQNLNILDIPIAVVTTQYMQYIQLMETHHRELAAEYLLMAAILLEIKAKCLLPKPIQTNEIVVESDPRLVLVQRLQYYAQFRQAADNLDKLPRLERERFPVGYFLHQKVSVRPMYGVRLDELVTVMQALLKRGSYQLQHRVVRTVLSVKERMFNVLAWLKGGERVHFFQLLQPEEGRLGIVVTFLALLELHRQSFIQLEQEAPYLPIMLWQDVRTHE